MTAATVGYGYQTPVTTGGRIVGVVMLTVGIALFATFSGVLAERVPVEQAGEAA